MMVRPLASCVICLQRETDPVSIFMGVPTMYTYLLSQYRVKMGPEEQQRARQAASRLRLTISGSGACPVSLMKQWKAVSGDTAASGLYNLPLAISLSGQVIAR